MANSKAYSGISETGLGILKKDLKSMGITPPEGDSGIIEYQGVKLGVEFASAAQKLTIRILEKPPFIPENLIWQLLDGRVQKCIGQ
ncbi:MAG: hypothetical protein ACRD22_18875 [Terriglobia bacterium]